MAKTTPTRQDAYAPQEADKRFVAALHAALTMPAVPHVAPKKKSAPKRRPKSPK